VFIHKTRRKTRRIGKASGVGGIVSTPARRVLIIGTGYDDFKNGDLQKLLSRFMSRFTQLWTLFT